MTCDSFGLLFASTKQKKFMGTNSFLIRTRIRVQRGFTLIELMITVAIIGLMAALAYPSYQSHLIKSRRAAAEAQLMLVAQQQSQYLLDARAYAADLGTLKVTLPTNVSAYYTFAITVVAGPPPTYTVTATPIAGTAQASDVTLSLDSAGTKSPSSVW